MSYGVDPERSVVLIEVRSSAGPISFGAIGVTGSIEAVVRDHAVAAEPPPRGRLEVPVQGLRSGNKLYDAEILRRIDARKFPIAALDLHDTVPTGVAGRYRLAGELTFHGVTRTIEGSVVATITSRHLVVEGEEVFDIRDFDVASPTVLMLRIFPDVRVRIHVEANAAEPEP